MLTGKPTILVPSPNVAEDHQTINARAIGRKMKQLQMVKDSDAKEHLIDEAISLLANEEKQEKLSTKIRSMAHENAAVDIANEVLKLIA